MTLLDVEEIAYSCFFHGYENTPLTEELRHQGIPVTKNLLFEMGDYALHKLNMWKKFYEEIDNLIEIQKQKGSEEE